MRVLIFTLILLVASVCLGTFFVKYPGFLFIVVNQWMVQMPLWFAIIAIFLAFLLFYLFMTCIDKMQMLWYRLKNWWRFRKEQQAYSKTQHGLTLLIEGRWKKAERLLLAGVNQTLEPLVNYLGAAKAAQEQKAYADRDNYIQKAYQVAPDAELAIGLVQAELEYEQEQFEHAAATLNHLLKISPRHPQVLKLLEKIYVHLADWQHLQALIPSMRKAKLINGLQTEQFEKNLYCEILRQSDQKSLTELRELWNSMPRYLQKNPEVICEYVKQLLKSHPILVTESDYKEMEELIRKCLKNHWQGELVNLYGKLPFTNLNRQLIIVGAWLKLYGPKQETLLLLGKLCVKVKLWGRAKDYFEKCLVLGPNMEASLEYGKLLEQLGETNAALEVYRTGLTNTVLTE